MQLLKDLLDIGKKLELTEARHDGDMSTWIEQYCDQEKIYNFEGSRGVNNFEKIIRVLGYQNMDDFLEDNSGCLKAMVEWLWDQNNTEWVEAMKKQLPDEDGDK